MTLRISVIIALVIASISLQAQDFNIGVRAGLNVNTFRGPMETNIQENYGYSTGFHFGINYQQNFTDLFGVRLEVLYIQKGATQTIGNNDDLESGPNSYYIIPKTANGRVVEYGQMLQYDLDISNAYVSFPITAHFQLSDKWEILGGAYASMLVGPTATGLMRFRSNEHPTQIVFEQAMDYRFNSDNAGQGQFVGRGAAIIVDGVRVDLPRFAGAYFQHETKNGNAINFWDFGLIAGINYNINSGFYVGLRTDLGLKDLTNNKMDVSRERVSDTNSFIYRNDKDTNFGLEVSFGFKF